MKWNILFFIIVMCVFSAYAGATQFKDIGEIMNEDIYRQDSLRYFEAYRFRYDDIVTRIDIIELRDDEVDFALNSNDRFIDEQFSMKEGDKKSFDLDKDNKVDFSLILDEIELSPTRRRITATFTTEYISPLTQKPVVEDDGSLLIPEVNVSDSYNDDSEDVEVIITDDDDLGIEYMDSDEQQSASVSDTDKALSEGTFSLIAWILVLLILIIIIAAFFAIEKKRK
ncbi:hypothetical protein H6503_03500 [Candidatus Woesearchaeota archaeon]|nr:hypothetical protein [Candidatus Woesearchaeota archaeon]